MCNITRYSSLGGACSGFLGTSSGKFPNYDITTAVQKRQPSRWLPFVTQSSQLFLHIQNFLSSHKQSVVDLYCGCLLFVALSMLFSPLTPCHFAHSPLVIIYCIFMLRVYTSLIGNCAHKGILARIIVITSLTLTLTAQTQLHISLPIPLELSLLCRFGSFIS